MTSALTTGLALYALYWVIGIIQPQIYRTSFLLVVLSATFLLYPGRHRSRRNVTTLDWLLVLLSTTALLWPIIEFDEFVYRAATPNAIDLIFGSVTILLILEATRRTVGPVLPITAIGFLLYGYYGAVCSSRI